MKHITLTCLSCLIIYISNAQSDSPNIQSTTSFDQESVREIAQKRLKSFLKVEKGTGGWFNSFVTTLYNKGETVARRGQVDNYLWSNEKFVAFHFFTYGGGSNTHYITCVDSSGNVTAIEHVLTESLKLDNYFNVGRHGEYQILATEETQKMNMSNPGKSKKDKTYVKATVYGINKEGAITRKAL